MTSVRAVVDTTRHYASLLNPDLVRGYMTMPRVRPADAGEALDAAVRWMCRAQDAFDDGGVARSYSLAYNLAFRRGGWIHSYPETTGYIIPTFFDYARSTGRDEIFQRAIRMADWECDVQLTTGAVQGGTIDQPPTPAIFNTGQVIFGWIRAYQETGHERYLASAVRAGNFLVAAQDGDGAWRRSLSQYASASMSSYTYNTRTAWALQMLAAATGNAVYGSAAVRNVEFALTQQLANGWFHDNCLYDPARPLLHTIAYSVRGILEIGIALENGTYIAAAKRAADALLATQRADGRLAGRYDARWTPAVDWSCLTGNAQMGTIWARLCQVTGERKYFDALVKANRFLRCVQWRGTGNPGLDGGISGSDPFHGRYGRFEVLNWAVKFFADSLMFEAALADAGARPASGSLSTTPPADNADQRHAPSCATPA